LLQPTIVYTIYSQHYAEPLYIVYNSSRTVVHYVQRFGNILSYIFVQNNVVSSSAVIIIIMRVIYIAPKNVKQTHRRINSHCTSAKRMTIILRHVAEAFPPARQTKILNSNRVIGIAANTSVMLNCALVTYIMMRADVFTAGCSLTSYSGQVA